MNTNQFSSLKIFRHADKIAKYQAGQTPYPVSVDLSPSNFCNHKCVWCVYANFLKESRDVLEKDVLFSLIDNLKSISVRGINFTGGGEPLTNKSTVEAMEKAYGLGMDVGLITNGALLDKENIKRLKRISKYIRVSLDAGKAKTYSMLHNVDENEFVKVLSMVELLGSIERDTECRVGVQLLQVAENNKETFSITKLLKGYGIHFVEVRPAININNNINEIIGANEPFLADMESLSDEKFKVLIRCERFRMSEGFGKDYENCVSPHFLAAFSADGNFYTCCELLGSKQHMLGNFRYDALENIFNFSRIEKKLKGLNLKNCPKYCKAEMTNRTFEQLSGLIHYNIL